MRKKTLITIIFIVICPLIIWGGTIIKCELLTHFHWKEFEGLEETTNMLSRSDTIKVLNYSSDSARVYYRDREGGDILKFVKQDSKWILQSWERTVWSRTGSADGFMWPYIR